MSAPLEAEALAAIQQRDDASSDGVFVPDYLCADDRHALLTEVHRLQGLVARLQSGRPTAG